MVRVEWGLVVGVAAVVVVTAATLALVTAFTLALVIAFTLAKECLWDSSLEPSEVLVPGWRDALVLSIVECWMVFEYFVIEAQVFGLRSGDA
jgi:hypothetical protein